jgi:hypothetical protein
VNPPAPESTLSPRLFILGSEITPDNKLHIYVHGLDAAGNTIPLADFQTGSVVTVDGTVRLDNGVDVNGGGVTVQLVPDGSPISLAFLTDYSFSIDNAGLEEIGLLYQQVLNALPAGFEAQVLNFSDFSEVRQDWTEDVPTLLDAVQFDPNMNRNNTAFYDGIGSTLYRDDEVDGFGLSERCRAARILVSYTDGIDNASFTYNKADLLTEIDDSRTVAIMLGTQNADKAELDEFAGSRGAFVYAFDVDDLSQAFVEWATSLGTIVEIVIEDGAFQVGPPGAVQIDLDVLSETVEAPYDLPCNPLP